MTRVFLGIDRLFADETDRLRGRRVGVLAHPASCTAGLEHLVDRLRREPGMTIGAIFGPEHGYRGEAQDMEGVAGAAEGGVPVYSLYGKTRASLVPPPVSLAGLDVLVVDLQDVGSRYYTFAATMAYCMDACAKAGVPVLVLDRPNPIGGALVEGPVLEEGFASFVGPYPLPVRHGMTIGELARFFNERFGIGCELDVLPMTGWTRAMEFSGTGLPWVLPSPNMPTPDTARVYPGLCLIEATSVSEGRGTTRPFELIGSPGIDPDAFAAALTAFRLPGAAFRACSFRPAFQKHRGARCGGVQIHVTDPGAFRPFRTGLAIVQTLTRLDPDFAWRDEPYEFETDRPAFDLLVGNAWLRPRLLAGESIAALEDEWRDGLARFVSERAAFLLYR
jgi:uncharacterized protein YbbC (DUF1343 family)